MCVGLRIIGPLMQLTIRIQDPRRYRFYNLERWSSRAYLRGDLVNAEALAREYLGLAECLQGDWNYGNAIDHGNQVLGLICLDRGDAAGAKEHLRLAGRTPGSPQLNSYGPRLALAAALVRAGETGAVLEYLDQVGRFLWSYDEATLSVMSTIPGYAEQSAKIRWLLDSWKDQVRRGEVPDHPQWTPRKGYR